jgi:2-oxo-4-hydroxy-4-carboxy-5-ureidoimidazoline decarboxylase
MADARCADSILILLDERFSGLFEHSPWVVTRAGNGPFADAAALHRALMDVVMQAGFDEQLALIRAHPELGAKQVKLTQASDAEQAGAGLQALSEEEFAAFTALNAAYRDKFGFPFIICVRMHSKAQILKILARRLENDAAVEHAQALFEIGHIARLRLQDLAP